VDEEKFGCRYLLAQALGFPWNPQDYEDATGYKIYPLVI
jgi:hypothetical protein